MFKDILTVYGKGTRTRQECQVDTEMLIVSQHATESIGERIAGMTTPEYLAKAKPDEPFVDADHSTSILSIEYVAMDSDHTGNED
ncbi:hypothetical protein [Nocardia sp. CA-119907]|uniref:hypothetical protein n=1 Tax=Nocardia sp. CA-119907 TaxID=3239973 RepID=UPI003D96D477